MRTITDHIVQGDSVNHQLAITVLDEPGQGGACHVYALDTAAGLRSSNSADKSYGEGSGVVKFQNGPIKEFGVNGVTQEALIAIVIDRLRSFQTGPFACRDNAVALTHFEEGLMWLQRRTLNRIKRGVEGTNQK